jgi:sigma-B regulation protein RsbU (phosphoserine phosphatase)
VSGKGVSAAFLMSNFQASLMALFQYLNPDLKEAVRLLNERVMFSAMGEKYITLFIATFDPKTRKLNYINCGHNPPVLVLPNEASQLLSLGSIGLGMFEEIPRVQEGEMILPSDALMICYTDGLVEQENDENEEFGIDRLAEIGATSSGHSAENINARIMSDFNAFRGDTPFVDDTALLTCRFI